MRRSAKSERRTIEPGQKENDPAADAKEVRVGHPLLRKRDDRVKMEISQPSILFYQILRGERGKVIHCFLPGLCSSNARFNLRSSP